MSVDRYARRSLTAPELDDALRSLRAIGGVYLSLADVVERYERPRVAPLKDRTSSS